MSADPWILISRASVLLLSTTGVLLYESIFYFARQRSENVSESVSRRPGTSPEPQKQSFQQFHFLTFFRPESSNFSRGFVLTFEGEINKRYHR